MSAHIICLLLVLLLLSFEAASYRPGRCAIIKTECSASISSETRASASTNCLAPVRNGHGFLRFLPMEDVVVRELYEASCLELEEVPQGQEMLDAISAGTHKKIGEAFVKALMGYIWNEDEGSKVPSNRIIPRNTLLWILALASDAFSKETSCEEIKGGSEREVVVIGDTHGQLGDLFHILSNDEIVGLPSHKKQIVFNGDLVDRGDWGTEIVALVSALKACNPETISVIRGNHESWRMTARFGFQEEVMGKYEDDTEVLFTFQRLFQSLPLSAFVSVKGVPRLFISHGGIGRNTHDMTLDEIARINRFREPWEEQVSGLGEEDIAAEPDLSTVPLSELLWSDPVGGLEEEWAPNRSRGLPGGFLFGEKALDHFLKKNSLAYMVRSHQPPALGFKGYWTGKCYTVFSASNYCGSGNQGAVLRLFSDQSDSVDPVFVQYQC